MGLSSFTSGHKSNIMTVGDGGEWYVTYPSPDEMDCDSGGNDVCDIAGFLKKK